MDRFALCDSMPAVARSVRFPYRNTRFNGLLTISGSRSTHKQFFWSGAVHCYACRGLAPAVTQIHLGTET